MEFRLNNQAVVLRPLRPDDRDALARFARTLPADDLLFLDRDISQDAEVDRWISEAGAQNLFTILALRDEAVIGYATFQRGRVRWTRHVAELRVVVGPSARGMGLGRLLLELVFEVALGEGVTKLVARMTPTQGAAVSLFQGIGFEQEAVLREHAMSGTGRAHDLLVLTFHTRLHPEQLCGVCGAPVLKALTLDRLRLCSHCYELRYQELGGGA